MFKKTMAMALAGLMLTSMAGTTALTAKAENDDVLPGIRRRRTGCAAVIVPVNQSYLSYPPIYSVMTDVSAGSICCFLESRFS